ncbi:MAG: caspase family protein, partial [Cytophagales bacterium]|nr:caspase family protein [Cytophagales bacterium]
PGGVAAARGAAGARKVALIVAVGAYPAAGGWRNTSAGNDVRLIREVLALHGFAPQHITVLADGRATKAGITGALDALIAGARKDDVVMIHFSAHGQQVFDDNDDEFDGFDEALVPYDAAKVYGENGYRGEHHLRDDELGEKLQRLGAKVGAGGSILVTLDACHSGSGTRGAGAAPARGTGEPLAPPGYAPVRKRGDDSDEWRAGSQARGEAQEAPGAPLVVISAAGPHQLNYETFGDDGRMVGSLSFALSKVLANAATDLTCGVAFDEIRLVMRGVSPGQRPELEGSPHRRLLGGTPAVQKPYFVPVADQNGLHIPAGTLRNVYPGTTVAFYPAGTADPSAGGSPLATGKVVASSPFYSAVALDGASVTLPAGNVWAFIREQHFGGADLTVKLDLPRHEDLARLLRQRLGTLPLVQLTDSAHADLLIDDSAGGGGSAGDTVFIRKKGKELYKAAAGAGTPEQRAEALVNRIRAALKAHYLVNKLKLRDETLKVVCELVPVQTDEHGRYRDTLPRPGWAGRYGPQLVEGDRVILRVANRGTQPVYFTIVDIQPDEVAAVVVPYAGAEPKDFMLRPNEVREIRGFPHKPLKVAPPYGEEVFQVIATRQPVDLRGILAGGDVRARGLLTPLERLLRAADARDGTRGEPSAETAPPGAAHVASLVFSIVPKQP